MFPHSRIRFDSLRALFVRREFVWEGEARTVGDVFSIVGVPSNRVSELWSLQYIDHEPVPAPLPPPPDHVVDVLAVDVLDDDTDPMHAARERADLEVTAVTRAISEVAVSDPSASPVYASSASTSKRGDTLPLKPSHRPPKRG